MNADKNSAMSEDIKNGASNDTNIYEHPLRMQQGNIVKLTQIPFNPKMFNMCEEMELVETKPGYEYDSNNKPILNSVTHITYTCVDGKNWFNFKIQNQSKPVISQAEIDRRSAEGNPVIVKIPLDKIIFKPYQSKNDRGIVRVSLQIPYIEVLPT